VKLNLGCGHHKLPGWVNVDHSAACEPDAVLDLESFPWPWPDDSADEVMLRHVLEHLGASTAKYYGVIRELWRVCRDGALERITVPHVRHDDYLDDPSHVRPITVAGLQLLSRKANEQWIATGAANTPLAMQLGVDFELVHVDNLLEEPWATKMRDGSMSEAEIFQDAARYNNVIKEQRIVLKAIKG
jgi:hypothetical protein